MSNKDFYRAFEDKHRGSRELIKDRVSVYLPFVLPLKKLYPDATSLDIGCGRGEWLELLKENDIFAQGIDFDEGMLKACHTLGLNVRQGNGILYLKEQLDESIAIISAFHVVEHISFEDLQELVQESMRVLKPGGILMLETPNPENIKVSSENFYLDPTHIKPIPSDLLSFLPEFYGYTRTKVLRLNESKKLANQESVNLLQVIEGASPDYAVIAQKEANEEILKQFDEVFSKNFGVSLNSLTDKFENRLLKIEAKANDAVHNYHIIMNSNSWKITKPLRLMSKGIRWFSTAVEHWVTFSSTSRPRRTLKKVLVALKHYLNANPKLKMKVMALLNRFPMFKVRLKNLKVNNMSNIAHERDELTFQAQNIYSELKQLCNNFPNTAEKNQNQKMAIVTPLPPDKTGIADYIAELLPSLSKIYDIEIITDTVESFDSYPVHNTEFFESNVEHYSRIIYQVGNSPYHWYMFDLIRKFPGIVVLHDFYLGNVIHWIQYNKNSHSNIWDNALIDSHGYSSVYMRSKKGIVWTVDHYPSNIEILQYAKGIIVHSKYAKKLSTSWYGQKCQDKFYHLPQVHKEFTGDRTLNSKEFLVCSFGHIIKQKLIHKIISAWINAGLDKNPNNRLVFVGNCHTDEYGLNIIKLVKSLANVEITGFVEDEEFKNYLKSANVAIQLRAESKGETSRAVLDCLAYGVPTIINENSSMTEFPDNVVYKIRDKFEEYELSSALTKLNEDENLCKRLSENAKEIIAENHTPAIVSKKMKDIIQKVYNTKSTLSLGNLCNNLQKNNTSISDQEFSNIAKAYEMDLRTTQMPNLYIDISVVATHDLKTGIQRVVRSILTSVYEMPTIPFNIVPVYLTDQDNYWHYRVAHNFMTNLVPDLVSRKDTVIEPSNSEVFIGLDFYAGGISEAIASGLFETWKKRGASINFIVYDILPIQFPKFFPDIAYDPHVKWLNDIGEVSDNILCISETVADEVRDYLMKSKRINKDLPNINFFHLGADIENSLPSRGLPDEAENLLAQFRSSQSFLMIGTIEPRKGHMQILLAFEKLWEKNIDVTLVIVGKEGWTVEELANKIRKHPELNKRLFWIEGASDEYLEKIYAVSTCLIAASEGEGFGLPLIESAQYKKPIIARDIPVFKEVAGEYAYYFDNDNNPSILADTIKKWLELYKTDKHPKSDDMPWLTWEESTEQLLNCLNINQNQGK